MKAKWWTPEQNLPSRGDVIVIVRRENSQIQKFEVDWEFNVGGETDEEHLATIHVWLKDYCRCWCMFDDLMREADEDVGQGI